MLKASLLSLAAAGFLFAGSATVPTAPAEAGYYNTGYGGHGYRRHYRRHHYHNDCHYEYKRVKVRYYDDYYGHYDYKYVTKKIRVCDHY